MLRFVFCNQVGRDVGDGFPSSIVFGISKPFDEIFNPIAASTLVQECFDFVVNVVVDFERRRRRLTSAGKFGVRGFDIRAQTGDVEDGVDLQEVLEIETEGDWRDLRDDLEGADMFGLELSRWTFDL